MLYTTADTHRDILTVFLQKKFLSKSTLCVRGLKRVIEHHIPHSEVVTYYITNADPREGGYIGLNYSSYFVAG